MSVETTINRKKALPDGVEHVIEVGLQRRLNKKYENCILLIQRAGVFGMSVFVGYGSDSVSIEEILQETKKIADEWFY